MRKKTNLDEFKKLHITVKELKRLPNKVKYIINGKTYTFAVPDSEVGEESPFAYCLTTKKWAWIYPNYVYFKDEIMLPAEKI